MTVLPGNSDRVPRRMSRAALLDASGRRIMGLRAGANDLSRLPAGVYFYRMTAGGFVKTLRLVLVK